jgi:hypothetical protein
LLTFAWFLSVKICTNEISGLNPAASSQIREFGRHFFSHRSNLEKKNPNAHRQTKIFGRQWRPGDRKFRALA